MTQKGKIISWNQQKGFGFISPDNGGDDVFFHISALADKQSRPRIQEPVNFKLGTDSKGRLSASKVAFVNTHSGLDKYTAPFSKAQWFSVIFLGFVALSIVLFQCPYQVLVAYLVLSVVTFAVYAHDKRAAQAEKWRTKEATLHLLALIGGWPGALWAQKILRHKSQKQPFKAILWLTIILNCAAFVLSFTPEGMTLIKQALQLV
ncbi:cold shock and DUF1294 domain-containing protein [Photobacterium leiognathi]|uniref:cold shock and DUF1294 domain-containing protein n=1 Tax=Photobacterium leiognathi TaxID=553611 RepID=UPI002981B157|nr:cold shock and DUF1294 domain-containing protein [Photobacterium leiognathi]